MRAQGYISITEAARIYGVSRAKITRLIQREGLHTERDPRDARSRVVREADIARVLGGHAPYEQGAHAVHDVRDVGALTMSERYTVGAGRLTAQQRAQVDALRARLARGRPGEDSVDIIRREREKRTRTLDQDTQQ